MWKRLALWVQETLECFRQNLMRCSDENVKDQKPTEARTENVGLVRFQRKAKGLLATELETIGIPFQQRIWMHYTHALKI